MAINKNGWWSGSAGQLVTYNIMGTAVTRARPGTVKQTKASKTSARDFGIIKSVSSRLREGLKDIIANYKSKPVMFAMDSAVRRWYYGYYLRRETADMDHVYFSSLELNKEAGPYVKPILGVEPVIDWSVKKKILLHIPEMKRESMLLPVGAEALSFTLIVSHGTMDSREVKKKKEDIKSYGASVVSETAECQLSKKGTAAMTLEINNSSGLYSDTLFLAYLSVRYKVSGKWLEEEKWKPVVVVGSWFGK
jgi:hypothetical protein